MENQVWYYVAHSSPRYSPSGTVQPTRLGIFLVLWPECDEGHTGELCLAPLGESHIPTHFHTYPRSTCNLAAAWIQCPFKMGRLLSRRTKATTNFSPVFVAAERVKWSRHDVQVGALLRAAAWLRTTATSCRHSRATVGLYAGETVCFVLSRNPSVHRPNTNHSDSPAYVQRCIFDMQALTSHRWAVCRRNRVFYSI